jgi:hypothetical protein
MYNGLCANPSVLLDRVQGWWQSPWSAAKDVQRVMRQPFGVGGQSSGLVAEFMASGLIERHGIAHAHGSASSEQAWDPIAGGGATLTLT